MATYFIGDVQGCLDELQDLLTLIDFNRNIDQLNFVGDLVNRGPKSLEVLNFIHELPNSQIILGNHDLHLLALGYKAIPDLHPHTMNDILTAPNCQLLLDWLRQQPLLHVDHERKFVMIHAGIPPQWQLEQAQKFAQEVENTLRSNEAKTFLQHMFGNQPDTWNEHLKSWDRIRYITNALTRIRFCTHEGQLNLTAKGTQSPDPKSFFPWFEIANPSLTDFDIFFGHWAALKGQCEVRKFHNLDTGCVWGGELTAFRLEDHQRFSVPARA